MTADRPRPTAADTGAEIARLYDLDLSVDPGDVDLYLALAARTDRPIVELAVGSGRIAVPLAAAGHRVTGIDLDPAMLARARVRAADAGEAVAGRIELVHGDLFTTRPPGSGRFGLAILALNTILEIGGRRQQREAIGVMAELLGPGGIAVVDAWQPLAEDLVRFDGRVSLEWLRNDHETGRDVTKLAAAWYEGATRAVTLTVIFDEAAPGGSPVRWTRVDALHLVSADELRAHAEDAGLEVEVIAGDYDLSPLSAGADRAILVARKPGGSGPD
ncbi:MAG TPA: class I SAM-dependent methyltransferase [Candidatus Limnocylindrales bacterium]|nr:class I SAM-dependent methyltransferase [Candidatus Limnocylindrales bacterium]